MRADLGAFLDDADAGLGARILRELLQADCRREPGRARADDHDVEFHTFARVAHAGSYAARRFHRSMAGREISILTGISVRVTSGHVRAIPRSIIDLLA